MGDETKTEFPKGTKLHGPDPSAGCIRREPSAGTLRQTLTVTVSQAYDDQRVLNRDDNRLDLCRASVDEIKRCGWTEVVGYNHAFPRRRIPFLLGLFVVTYNDHGDMLLRAADQAARRELAELRAEKWCDIADALGDAWLGNGWWLRNADAFGALSQAPTLTEDFRLADNGDMEPDSDETPLVFAHMDYMVEDPFVTWARGDAVRFIRAEVERR